MKAAELREAAESVSDTTCRSMLLQIAQDYENLANAAETRSHAQPTVCEIHPTPPAVTLPRPSRRHSP
ncbi:MAG: hypothetical protein ACM30I_15465 [Gemmatimonas sp.]